VNFTNLSSTAILLAAGLGKRLLPLTFTTPKPLIPINDDHRIIDYPIQSLKKLGFKGGIINTHHLAPQMDEYFKNDAWVHSIHEPQLLETGGGVSNILKTFPNHFNDALLCINSDAWFSNNNAWDYVLKEMSTSWDPSIMDVLLLFIPQNKAPWMPDGNYDYSMAHGGKLNFKGNDEHKGFYGGVQIIKKELFNSIHDEKYSLKIVYDHAESNNKLYGVWFNHDSIWSDLGTHDALKNAQNFQK
jgi:MurNAc alpha-1-phosphate uridylyltransferase